MPDHDFLASLRPVRRILITVLVLNLAVAVAKLAVGAWTRSISMLADGFHSLTDTASNVVGLIGISLAARPPDADHPYGHRKFETLSALGIGGLLAVTAWEVLQSCFDRLWTGGAPEVRPASFVVMGVTMAVNLAVSTYEARAARRLGSGILAADAAHTRSDVYVSTGVILSLLAAHWGLPQLDVVAALGITVLIARAAWNIVRGSADQLLDAAVMPADEIREIALAVPGVEGVHKVRTRGDRVLGHADLHVQVRGDLRIDQAHVIGHLVVDRLRQQLGFRDVVVHVEPPPGHRTDWRPDRREARSEPPSGGTS